MTVVESARARPPRWVARHRSLLIRGFVTVVVLHWVEHLVQALQIYAWGWPIADANGILGLKYPWLVTSEVMHYGYALVMMIGLGVLRDGFDGFARQWWMLSLTLQVWHHTEHLLLLTQASLGRTLDGGPVPVSMLQFFVPRVELHLFYNTVVTVPMVVAMVLAMRQRRDRGVRHEHAHG